MNIRQISGFIELAKTGNFSKAADAIYITQPAFSRLIQSLEKEVGGKLFERKRNDITLTMLGASILPEMQKMHNVYMEMLDKISQHQSGNSNDLIFGVLESGMPDFLYKVAFDFTQQENQNIKLKFVELNEANLYDALKTGQIDIASHVHMPDHLIDETVQLPLFDMPLCVLMSSSHRLAQRKSIKIEDLINEKFVMVERKQSPLGYRSILNLTQKAGFEPIISKECNHLNNLKSFIQGDYGITILPLNLLSGECLVYVPLENTEPISFSLVWMKNNKKEYVKDFSVYAKEIIKEKEYSKIL